MNRTNMLGGEPRLILNKDTLRTLGDAELNEVAGGIFTVTTATSSCVCTVVVVVATAGMTLTGGMTLTPNAPTAENPTVAPQEPRPAP
jgi:hypothetical protein